MAKFFQTEKWKKRTLTVLSVAFAASLSMGVFAACTTNSVNPEESDPVSPTDTQLLRNGNFEFYSDNNQSDALKKLKGINSPDSWSFTSGSPSSDTASGIISMGEWAYFTRTGGYNFPTYMKGEEGSEEEVTTFSSIDDAVAHWEDENVSAYDRIKFLDIYDEEIDALDSNSEAAKLFAKYDYSIDFDDIRNLDEDFPEGIDLHSGVKEGEDGVLMIHNDRLSDGVRGTAQYYTSSTTITLSAGTSAKVSVWVRTDKLVHYENTDVTARAGAYIGVTNTVGGTTLEQMQIKNINTRGEWREYTLYVRASTFATSTIRIVLGLGQGSSDDRYFSVNGYAFFDDVACEIISNADFNGAVLEDAENLTPKSGVQLCTVNSLKEEKQFDTDNISDRVFALDLYAGFETDESLLNNAEIGLTEERSGSNTYTSEKIDSSLNDSLELNYTASTTLERISNSANLYLKNVYENDFKDKFPFENKNLIMLLSGNGAAYTAKLQSDRFILKPDERMLISFFAKTNKISSGLTGASATIVDGENRTQISAFDSTAIATIDIDSKSDDITKKDIYKGWVQCFFFLENDTDEDKVFSLELSFGPTVIVGTNKFSYGDGYAAFANFETKMLNKTEYSYATTGDRAKKVSLKAVVEESRRFDSVSATDELTIENRPALPANFRGVLGGSNFVVEGGKDNTSDGVVTGLLSYKYADNYFASEESWKENMPQAEGATDGETWWKEMFGNARQPLVIINNEEISYGYFAATESFSESSYQRISMRVKATPGARAFVYLTDTKVENTGKSISPNLPSYTYWYDDEGNIVNMDPSDENFEKEGKILFELQSNGLYQREGDSSYYANLHNFTTDSEGNLLTKDGEIVFFHSEGKFYAYREESANGKYTFSTPVENLPTDIVRYDYSNKDALPVSEMEIVGTGEWITVNFYIHTGDEAKSYRLEVWNGSRDGTITNKPGSYVFFDNYSSSSASSNYSDLLEENIEAIKDKLNEGKDINDPDYLGADDNLPEEYALYYTFTFYDSVNYVRYDETTDEDEVGNPWGSYLQSSNSEQLVTLFYRDTSEENSESYNFFLDYSAIDMTVSPDDLSSDEEPEETEPTDQTTATDTNIWLLFASGILAVVLVLVIIIVIVRKLFEKRNKRTKIKPAKDKRVRAKKSDEE